MSRHLRIAQDLDMLQQNGVIESWVKDSDVSDPQRVRWVVRFGPFDQDYLLTTEAEAFVKGARAALTAKV